MSNNLFVRRDDPTEKVRIIIQARSPDGLCQFEFITPEHYKGRMGTMPNSQFHAAYKPENEPPPTPPVKPLSTGSRDEWRAWALKLEADLAEIIAENDHR